MFNWGENLMGFYEDVSGNKRVSVMPLYYLGKALTQFANECHTYRETFHADY